ncbi:MAG: preprotein translocase subunit SecE [Actinomycetota bacterium]
MNRQMKRMQERQERKRGSVAERREAATTSARRGANAPAARGEGKKKRTGARQFLKEVRQELRKVDWPTRRELASYTVVVLVTVIVMTSLVYGLDFIFSKVILNVLAN